VEEFIASGDDPEELADILEVLYALAEQAGSGPQQLEGLRAAKAEERGGFGDRIIWSGNRPADAAREHQLHALEMPTMPASSGFRREPAHAHRVPPARLV
jgi:hypothetical protein